MWAALLAVAMTSFSLVTAEFLPSGLLTLIASDLGITPGAAAQMVTVTAIVGFIVAPLVGVMTPGVDRRTLLVWLAVAAAVSDLIVAMAPNLVLLLISRILLGAALSGFWAMSLTVAAHITGADRVAKGMMLVNGGTTLATVLGVPVGIWLASLMNWRAAFIGIAALTIVTSLAVRMLLPRVPAQSGVSLGALGSTLRVRGVAPALIGHVLVVMGHMAAYALIRLALERVPSIDASGVALLLVLFGIGGFVGNLVFGMLADKNLAILRFLVPALTTSSIAIVALMSSSQLVIAVAVVVWGAGFGGWLVVINTWASHEIPQRLESGGGLIVAGFQLAIALGAAIGGIIVDNAGVTPALLFAATAAAVGTLLFGFAPSANSRPGADRIATPSASAPCAAGTHG